MHKRISKKPRRKKAKTVFEPDVNQLAAMVIERLDRLGESPRTEDAKTAIARWMGQRGGKIGGKRSLETMTKGQRIDRARKAAAARWLKKKAP